MVDLSAIEEIAASIDRLNSTKIDCDGKDVHFTAHAVGPVISIFAHEFRNGEAPILGVVQMSLPQWRQLSEMLGPVYERHQIAMTTPAVTNGEQASKPSSIDASLNIC